MSLERSPMVIFPIMATIVALGCCLAVLRDHLARPKPASLVWTIAFAIFAIAAFAEVLGTLAGWTPLLARVYYVLGATLVVGYLALGELYLLAPRRWVDRVAGGLIVLSALAVALVNDAAIGPNVADRGWQALDRGPLLTALTIGLNTSGTTILVGGLVYSAIAFKRRRVMRNRMIGCLLIAAGTLTVASGGTLTRLGSHQYLYIAMSLGVAFIFVGYLTTRRPDAAPAHVPLGLRSATSAESPAAGRGGG